jgi:hypothetical protein
MGGNVLTLLITFSTIPEIGVRQTLLGGELLLALIPLLHFKTGVKPRSVGVRPLSFNISLLY